MLDLQMAFDDFWPELDVKEPAIDSDFITNFLLPYFSDLPREQLAAQIWAEICQVAGITAKLPPWQIVRERRATIEATPEQNSLRPGPVTQWKNLFLAGDWTDTGLPATIEGSVRSGNRAADLVLAAGRT